ncbi:MAG: hypothetical protein ACYS5V_01795 [Planctomycetota bacterium]|jgi:hypothetical protein
MTDEAPDSTDPAAGGRGGSASPGGLVGRRFPYLALLGAWALLTVWSACLWVVGDGFGSSWAGMVEAASAELIALAMALVIPNFFLQKALLLTVRARPGDALAVRMSLAGRTALASAIGRAQWQVRLLAIASAVSVAGGLLTLFAGSLAADVLGYLAGLFVYPDWVWSLVRLGVRTAGFVPMALGIAAVALAGSLIRRAGSDDPYRYVTRDLMGSVGAGLAVSAGLWWLGADLRGVGFVCAVALAGLSVGALAHGATGRRVFRPSVPAAAPQRRGQRRRNLLAFAALSFGLTLQCRALRDAGGCDWAGTWLWIGLSTAVAAAMTRRLGGRAGRLRRVESGAIVAGTTVVAAMQLSLLALAALSPGARWFWIAAAGAGQVPFVGLWSILLAHRRRAFARSGRPQRYWLADAALGLALGAQVATGVLSAAGASLPALAGWLCLTAVFLMHVGAGASRPARRPAGGGLAGELRWAATGSVTILALALAWAGVNRAVGRALAHGVSVGASLTAFQGPDGSVGVLPVRTPIRADGGTDRMARRLVRSHPGRWRIVTAARADLASALAEGVRVSLHLPDRGFGRLPVWSGRAGAACLGAAADYMEEGLDGVYVDALPSGHPDGWSLHSSRAIRHGWERLGRGGLLMVRVTGAADDLAAMMGVARSFHRVVGGGQAAVSIRDGGVEVLLVGRSGPDARPPPLAGGVEHGAYVVSLKQLVEFTGASRPAGARAPGRRVRLSVGQAELAGWLAGVRQ